MNLDCYYKNFLTKPINDTIDEIIEIVLEMINRKSDLSLSSM